METVLVQINDRKAYKLLDDMEDLHIIKVLTKSKEDRLSQRYRGKLPADVADELRKYITDSRDAWSSRNT